MRGTKFIVAILGATSLAGCAALDTVHYAWPGPGDSTVITTDAKTRNLIMVDRTGRYPLERSGPLVENGDVSVEVNENNGSEGPVNVTGFSGVAQSLDGVSGRDIRVCAEPAPDVFSAFANSFSFGGIFGATSNDVRGANAFASTVSTIERTQTINLLRESFYRTCERYMSGAISRSEFSVLAARDHRSMIAVLAIEQLTGVVKPPSTIISGPAVNSSLAQSEELLKILQGYITERQAAGAVLEAARAEYTVANIDFVPATTPPAATPPVATPPATPGVTPVPPTTTTVATLSQATPSVPATAPAPKKLCDETTAPDGKATEFAKCTEAKAKVTAAEDLFKKAQDRESLVLNQLNALSGGIGAGTSAGHNSPGGVSGSARNVSDVQTAILASAAENIALTAGINEALLFCTSYLRREASALDTSTKSMCLDVVMASAQQDRETTETLTGLAQNILDGPRTLPERSETRFVGAQYEVFKIRFRYALQNTTPDKWDEKWAAFTAATPIVPQACSNLSFCQQLFSGSSRAPFSSVFFTNESNRISLLAAASVWCRGVSDNSNRDCEEN